MLVSVPVLILAVVLRGVELDASRVAGQVERLERGVARHRCHGDSPSRRVGFSWSVSNVCALAVCQSRALLVSAVPLPCS